MKKNIQISYTLDLQEMMLQIIEIVNHQQTTWKLLDKKQEFISSESNYTEDPFHYYNCVKDKSLAFPIIFVTHKPLSDNWFSHDFLQTTIISTFEFQQLETGFTINDYIVYQICQALIGFSIGKTEDDLMHLVHNPSIGCLFDMCSYKPSISIGMASGSLCEDCYEELNRFGASESILSDLTRLLNYVASSHSRMELNVNKNNNNINKAEMISILHISDLHFGTSFRFSPKVIKVGVPPVLEPFGNMIKIEDLILSDLERISTDPLLSPSLRFLANSIDLIVISGDIANSGGKDKALPLRENGPTDEYEQAAEFVNMLFEGINKVREIDKNEPLRKEESIAIVPGNHDVNWNTEPKSRERFLGYAKFFNRITGRKDYFDCDDNNIVFRKVLNIKGVKIALFGFNSCTITNEPVQLRDIGMVEDEQLKICDKFLEEDGYDCVRKIAIFHHHPIYIPSLGAGVENYDAILQAGKLLSYLQEKKFDLILHGHKHYPIAWVHNMIPYEMNEIKDWSEPIVVSSGSLTAKCSQLPLGVPNSFQLIGLRTDVDPLRPKCVIIRRKLPLGDLLHGKSFQSDGIFYLGSDNPSKKEREKNYKRLSESSTSREMTTSSHNERIKKYQVTDGWMLVHRYRKSQSSIQDYDISIYLKQHSTQKHKTRKISFVLYSVGEMWPGSPFKIADPKNGFELRLSAYGSFICIAEIQFSDSSSCKIERYIDFEMSDIFQ